MKKTRNIIVFLLAAGILAGCSYWPITIQELETTFKKSEVLEKNGSIIAKGKVEVYDSYGALVAVDVNENTAGTFNIVYTKGEGKITVFQDWREILSLEEGAVKDIDSGEVEVELEKGENHFIISGDDCNCEYTINLTASDISKIVGFDGGYLMPHE